MEFFRIKKSIPFMRHALVFNAISFITFLLAVLFLATKGLHYSIEFTGGTVIEAPFKQAADLERIRTDLTQKGFLDKILGMIFQQILAEQDELKRSTGGRYTAFPTGPTRHTG